MVPAMLVKTLGVGGRRTKTDRRDAQVLSEVSTRIDLPSVHVPSTWSREVKSECGMRDALVRARTQLINNVRGWMRGRGWRIRSRASATFTKRVGEIESLPAAVEAQLRRHRRAYGAVRFLATADSIDSLPAMRLALNNSEDVLQDDSFPKAVTAP